MVLSHATTQILNEKKKVRDSDSPDRQMIYFMDEDVPVYVGLPPEIDAPPGMCVLLKRRMYGTRRAADARQSEYSGSLIEFGSVQDTSSACVFTHAERQIMVSIHGDDFTFSGARPQLQLFEAQLMSNKVRAHCWYTPRPRQRRRPRGPGTQPSRPLD